MLKKQVTRKKEIQMFLHYITFRYLYALNKYLVTRINIRLSPALSIDLP